MTQYERKQIDIEGDTFHIDGDVVDVLEAPRGGRNTITVLVELPGPETAAAATKDNSEGVKDKSTWFCLEPTGDGEQCQREVDHPESACWQHE